MTISFTKMHGIGNDYILIDARQVEKDWSRVAVDICDRHFGVGGDGILLIRDSDVADCRMQIYNPDGSEAEACGQRHPYVLQVRRRAGCRIRHRKTGW